MFTGPGLVLVVHQRLVHQVSAFEILTTSTYHATTTTTGRPMSPRPENSEESSTWPAGSVAPRPLGARRQDEPEEEEVTEES